jgi:hypothetical protein
MLLGVNIGFLKFIELAILREFWSLFLGDPAPGVSDVGPPLSEKGAYIMIFTVLAIAALSLYTVFHRWSQWRRNKALINSAI